jgi:hypothetical protein
MVDYMNPKCLLLIIPMLTLSVCCTHLFAQGLTISNGSNVVVNGAANIVINNGGFSNSGTFSPGESAVIFIGPAVTSISGSSTSSFYNFLVNKTGSSISLAHNIGIANTLTMGDGHVNLNGFDLNLGTTGSITGERPLSRVLGPAGGFLIRSAVLNAPDKVSPGNIGLEITTASNPGLVTLKRGHQSLQLAGGFSIQRFYDISSASNIGDNATLRFHYFDEELGGVNESELGVYSITTAVPGGELEGQNITDPVANYIQVGGVALAGRFAPASKISDPARSSYLTAVLVNGRTLLSWGTAYEINTDHFELERSVNGGDFQRFANVTAAGTTTISNDYTYTDPDLATGPYYVSSPRYYRYKIVFKDGGFRYSAIVSVAPEGYPNHILQVYPSPTTGPVNVRFSSFKNQKVTLQVVDNTGNIVAQKEMTAVIGPNMVSCDISKVIKGVYYVRLLNIERRAYKIIKN